MNKFTQIFMQLTIIKHGIVLIILILGVFVWLLYFGLVFQGIQYSDAQYYFLIAKNVVQGRGYQTNETSPMILSLFKDNYFRVVACAPLHPLILSLFFMVFGIFGETASFCSGFFYILTATILYLLARELFNSKKIAIISSLLYLIDIKMLDFSISGLTEPLFIFLVLSSFYFLYKRESTRNLLLAGFLLGLARVTRINAIIFVLPFVGYIYFSYGKMKLSRILIFLITFITTSFPILWKDYINFGDPIFSGYHFGLAHFKYSSDVVYRSLFNSSYENAFRYMANVVFSARYDFVKEYLNNLARYSNGFFHVTHWLISSFFVVSVFKWFGSRKVNLLRSVFWGTVIIQCLMLSISWQPMRYFYIFIPFIIMFAVEQFFCIFEKIPFKKQIGRQLLLGFLFILLSIPLLLSLERGFDRKVVIQEKPKVFWLKDFIMENTGPSDIIATNVTKYVEWDCQRRALALPLSIEIFKKIDSQFLALNALLLTNHPLGYLDPNRISSPVEEEYRQAWLRLLSNPPLQLGSFRLEKQIRDKEGRVVILYKKVK